MAAASIYFVMTTEPLEPRRLLAGITLITHGYNSNVTGWVATAATDVQTRAGGKNASSIYTMTVAKSGSGLAVTGFTPDSGQKAYAATTAGELIIKLDWGTVSSGGYTTGQVAAVVSSYMLATPKRGTALAELPIHAIGHSRGASLVTALSQDLGIAGVWVDQVTDLDPHPVDGKNDFLGADFGDAKMAVYDNTVFADDYWRTDGNANNEDFDGEKVAGAYNGDLNSTVQKDFFISAHQAVTAYYVGTIDTGTLDGGDHPVIPSWYGTKTTPARTATGFDYSRIAGGSRPTTGLSTLLGGGGTRQAAGQKGSQWANVLNFSTRGSSSISAGETVDARFYVADRDSRSRVNVVADTDQSPYNGGFTVLSGRNFSSTALSTGRVGVNTAALKAGKYYFAAYVYDGSNHARWTYSNKQITVSQPDFTDIAGRVLTVTGTEAADTISVTSNDGSYDVTRNGANVVVDQSDVDSIVVQAGAGNDAVTTATVGVPVYVNGGAGFDTLSGGNGDDTLSGGAQSDVLNGGAGDDVLNGNGGNNLLSGNGGYDRLYSADGSQDTMLGGSNADRFFGGSGNDSMVGGSGNDKMYGNGGNDTILGGAGVDIVNGGAGSDTAEKDDLDLRVDIEIILSI